ncbi:MAG TPA: dephospho-CoA kinase [Candidatus Brocadiia bacterium]|nr:dephospho-CoA kinase [Candidatus Brocadiia bacterium]
MKPKVIGLAGGVASGKSTVARLFAEMGAAVVDADRIGHAVLDEPEVRQAVRRRWGDAVMSPDGAVNRQRLGAIVFDRPDELRELNRLTHPRIRERMRREIEHWSAEGRAPLIVLDAALLFEGGLEGWCDGVVFVEASGATRSRRAQEARGWTREETGRRESAQTPPEEKQIRCAWKIVNEGDLESTRRQARELFERLTVRDAEPPKDGRLLST